VSDELQLNGVDVVSENASDSSRTTLTNQSSTATSAPKMLMVFNKDGSKTIMTLVSGKSLPESESATSLLAEASNDSQDSNSGKEHL